MTKKSLKLVEVIWNLYINFFEAEEMKGLGKGLSIFFVMFSHRIDLYISDAIDK